MSKEKSPGKAKPPEKEGILQSNIIRGGKVKLKDLAIFSRQLAALVDTELQIVQSLTILAEQARTKYFQDVIRTIRDDVEAGSSMSKSMRKFPRVFDDLYCNLVASGEASGSLDTMLKRLSEYLEKNIKLRSQIKSAMIYPIAIVVVAVLVTIFMMWKVIPTFASIYESMDIELNVLTRSIMALSHFVSNNILYIFITLIAVVIIFPYIRRTEPGREFTDRVLLRVPLFGDLASKIAIARITRTLSTLVASGLSILVSLKIVAKTSGNYILERSIMNVRKEVSEGKKLAECFEKTKRFPIIVTQMINVGETTGTLESMMTKLADFYDDEVEATVASLLSLLEPILLLLIGGLVGLLVVSMYLPIFELMNQF